MKQLWLPLLLLLCVAVVALQVQAAPTVIDANPTTVVMNDYGDSESIDFDDHFTNYTSFYVEINSDPYTLLPINLTSDQQTQFNGELIDIELNLIGNILTFESQNKDFGDIAGFGRYNTYTMYACNDDGCSSTNARDFQVEINGVPPSLTANNPIDDLMTQSFFQLTNNQYLDYVTGMDYFFIEYVDPEGNAFSYQSDDCASSSCLYIEDYLRITMSDWVGGATPEDGTFIITSEETGMPYNITVFYGGCDSGEGCVIQDFTIFFGFGQDPPTQTASIADVFLAYNDTELLYISEYFDEYESVTLNYTNPDNSSQEISHSSSSVNNSFFTSSIFLNTLQFQSESKNLDTHLIGLTVCNSFGCVYNDFTLNINQDGSGGSDPTDPSGGNTNLDAVVDFLVSYWKLLVTTGMILSGAVLGAVLSKNNSIVTMIGGFLALILATAFGWVTVGWTILILLFMVFLLVMSLVFNMQRNESQ